MKLEGLMLKRAAAHRDANTILQIFSAHFSYFENGPPVDWWRFRETRYVPDDEMRLETPFGSFDYTGGLFHVGIHICDYRIVCNPGFYQDFI